MDESCLPKNFKDSVKGDIKSMVRLLKPAKDFGGKIVVTASFNSGGVVGIEFHELKALGLD